LQLGGNDPAMLAAAMRLVLPFGYDEINLNCGCPAIETGGGDYGASLMRDADATARIVAAMVGEASRRGRDVPISIKCRVGIVERAEDFLTGNVPVEEANEQLFHGLESFARKCVGAGAEHVVVHAREAVMAGLSPRGNRVAPPLRPDLAGRLARELDLSLGGGGAGASGRVAVTLNGGIASVAAAAEAMERWPALSGVQAGRWPLRRPTDMLAVDAAFYGSNNGSLALDSGEYAGSSSDRGRQLSASRPIISGGGGARGDDSSVRLADAGGAAAAAATRALESYVYRYALRELDAGTASAAELCRPLALVLADLDDRVEAEYTTINQSEDGDWEAKVLAENAQAKQEVAGNEVEMTGVILADSTRRLSRLSGGFDSEEATAASAVRSALLECVAALLAGGGDGDGDSRTHFGQSVGGGSAEAAERKTRRALIKVMGKKVEKKHRGNRAEALHVGLPPQSASMTK